MISYSLRCSNNHAFDGWFRGSDDFDMQVEGGLLQCPVCGDASISKALMAPNVSTGRAKEKAAKEVHQAMVQAKAALEAEASNDTPKAPVDSEVSPAPAAPPNTLVAASVPSLKDAPAPVKAYVETVRKLRAEVEANSEDVGTRFAEEARKMHHGEVDERPIRGEASLEEAAALDEEGIDVFVLPALPEDGH
ncbi:DUF1178 family protein [Ahrensia marina]|uniref:DUF1178 family protein n=1 Tax=Ahrensia marina TaxID=1514904 RepID=UPI0035D0CE4A